MNLRHKRHDTKDFYNTLGWQRVRFMVLVAFGPRCMSCGKSSKDGYTVIDVDHIYPKSRWPDLAMEPTNMQVLCRGCNFGKGTKVCDFRSDRQKVRFLA